MDMTSFTHFSGMQCDSIVIWKGEMCSEISGSSLTEAEQKEVENLR